MVGWLSVPRIFSGKPQIWKSASSTLARADTKESPFASAQSAGRHQSPRGGPPRNETAPARANTKESPLASSQPRSYPPAQAPRQVLSVLIHCFDQRLDQSEAVSMAPSKQPRLRLKQYLKKCIKLTVPWSHVFSQLYEPSVGRTQTALACYIYDL